MSGCAPSTSSQWRNGAGSSGASTVAVHPSQVRTFGHRSAMEAISPANSASATTHVASELSMTYAISSAVNRYESGTATMRSLRAAWFAATTCSEFGPHHTSRSPGATAAARALATRLVMALSSA